jgi:hypothetical protein
MKKDVCQVFLLITVLHPSICHREHRSHLGPDSFPKHALCFVEDEASSIETYRVGILHRLPIHLQLHHRKHLLYLGSFVHHFSNVVGPVFLGVSVTEDSLDFKTSFT